MIPPDSAYNAPIDPSARLLLILLWSYARQLEGGPFAWPTHSTLAGRLGVSERSIYRSLTTLRDAALVWDATAEQRWSDSGRSVRVSGWMLAPPPTDDLVFSGDEIVRTHAVPDEIVNESGRDRQFQTILSRSSDDLVNGSGRGRPEILTRSSKPSSLGSVTEHTLQHATHATHASTDRESTRSDVNDTRDHRHPTVDAEPSQSVQATMPLAAAETQPPSTPGRHKGKPKTTATLDPRVLAVLDRIDHHLQRAGRRPLRPSLRSSTAILALLDRGEILDDLLHALDLRARECAESGDWTHFNAVAPFSLPRGDKAGGWSWSVAAIERALNPGRQRPTGPRLDVDADGLEQRRREAEQWEAQRKPR